MAILPSERLTILVVVSRHHRDISSAMGSTTYLVAVVDHIASAALTQVICAGLARTTNMRLLATCLEQM
jgi:hypothetical protein